MNTFAPPKKEKEEKKSFLKHVAEYKVDFSLDDRKAVGYIPYFLFLTLLGVIYIANSYYNDSMIRKITNMEKQVEELRIDFSSYKYEYMLMGKPDEIERRVQGLGLINKDKPIIRVEAKQD